MDISTNSALIVNDFLGSSAGINLLSSPLTTDSNYYLKYIAGELGYIHEINMYVMSLGIGILLILVIILCMLLIKVA